MRAGIPSEMKSKDFDPVKFPSAMETFRIAAKEEVIGGGGAN